MLFILDFGHVTRNWKHKSRVMFLGNPESRSCHAERKISPKFSDRSFCVDVRAACPCQNAFFFLGSGCGTVGKSAGPKFGPNDHFGQNDLIPNWNLAFASPNCSILVHFPVSPTTSLISGSRPFWPFFPIGYWRGMHLRDALHI